MPSLSMPTRTKRPVQPAGKRNGAASVLPRTPGVEPPGRRRRPKWALAGLALLIVGGLLGMYLYTATGDRLSVVAVAEPVAFGEQLQLSDLVEVGVAADDRLSPVRWADVDDVVGMTAATDLLPGSLLTMSALTSDPIPGPGQELVPIALQASQLPAIGLRPRDEVLLVATTAGQVATTAGEESATPGEAGRPATGMVVRVGAASATGVVVVDVLVDTGDGAELAMLAADGRIALVVLPRGG